MPPKKKPTPINSIGICLSAYSGNCIKPIMFIINSKTPHAIKKMPPPFIVRLLPYSCPQILYSA